MHVISDTNSIQDTIDNDANDGDTILLNSGTYDEYDIIITKNIIIGANTAAGANAGNTFIDAQSLGRIFNVTGNYHLTIDNLTLRNGKAPDGDPALDFTHPGTNGKSGGAIQSEGWVTITSSIIRDCQAGDGGRGADSYDFSPPGFPGNGGYGGAINTTGRVIVNASSFNNCLAGNGGIGGQGIMSQGSAGGTGGNGGAIFTSDTAIIDSASFAECHAGDGGTGASEFGAGGNGGHGGAVYAMNFLNVTSSSLSDCTAGDAGITIDGPGGSGGNGGGIYTGNYTYPVSFMTMQDTTISNCKAGKGSDGSASAVTDGGNGGSGGGIYSTWPTTVTSSIITGCNATPKGQTYIGSSVAVDGMGGGYMGWNYGGTLTLDNSTFTGNQAPVGGAFASDGQDELRVTSSNISYNSASQWGAIYYWGSGTVYVNSSNFEGNSGGVIYTYVGQLHLNRFYNNQGMAVKTAYAGEIGAENNWWGFNSGSLGNTSTNVTYTPWIMLCATATPPVTYLGDTSAIRANLTYNTDGVNTSADGTVPDAIPVAFAVVSGSGSVSPGTGETTNGISPTTFTPTDFGISTIRTTVDGQSIDTDVTVPLQANFSGTPVSGAAPLTVQFNDTACGSSVLYWNWSFGNGDWFNTTDILQRNASYTYPSPGVYTVALTLTDATTSNTSTRADYITVNIRPPVVSGITPSDGVNTTTVSITDLAGADFNTSFTPGVRLNRTGYTDITATNVLTPSASQITCSFDLTGHDAGLWNVVVTNPDGQEAMLADGFEVQTSTPLVTGITPATGYNSSIVSITDLSGSGFWPGSSTTGAVLRRTGYTDIAATGITVVSAAQISCTFDLTGQEAGTWDVVVTNPDGKTATLPAAFEIFPPVPALTGITPAYGINTSTVDITDLAGSGFWAGSVTGVILNRTGYTDIVATGVLTPSSTQITCIFDITGQEEGPWNIVITNPDGQEAMLANGFRIRAPGPGITGITPAEGVNTTTVSIAILAGTGFWAGYPTGVILNRTGQPDIVATGVTVVDDTNITCTFDLTGYEEGLWNVVVTNPDGQESVLADGFRIWAPGPVITSIVPASGANSSAVSITDLAGSGFWPGYPTSVILNQTGYPDIVATGVTVADSTIITCTFDLTGHMAGLRNVVVINPDGQEAMLADGFTVRIPGPGITGVTPASGLNTGPVNITSLAGSGFWTSGTTNIYLNRTGHLDITADDVTVIDSTNITCTFDLSGQDAGLWNIVVINPDGQVFMLASGFRIRAPEEPAPTVMPTSDGSDSDYHATATAAAVVPTTGLCGSGIMQNVSVNIGGSSAAGRADTGGVGISDLIVTGTVRSRPDDGALPEGTVFQYIDLVPARYCSITYAAIFFSIPQSWLDEHDIAPPGIVLYRLTANGWETLPTTYIHAKDGTAYYSAASPGFSLFAITGIPSAATPEITTVAPSGSTVQEQDTLQAIATTAPTTTQTTAPPAPAPAPSSPFPVVPVLAVLCCAGLIGSGWYLRRWWIRRQNPALFMEYD